MSYGGQVDLGTRASARGGIMPRPSKQIGSNNQQRLIHAHVHHSSQRSGKTGQESLLGWLISQPSNQSANIPTQ
eukprot:1161217-Pelagomonas_calceolata.AAC.1